MEPMLLIAKLTFTEFRRNRWVRTISAVFAILILGLSLASSGSMHGVAAFGRLSATVVNMVLLFVPLIGFILGAQLIAADRDSGALVYLLSHPLRKRDIFFGKVLGAFSVLVVALSLGFGLSAILVAFSSVEGISSYLALWICSLLFSFLCIAIGVFLSALARNRSKALGLALFAWLFFTVISDLGLMGTSYILNIEAEQIMALVLLNPLQSFKILVIKLMASNLEVLGAGGMYFDMMLGDQMVPLLTFWLIFTSCFFLIGGMWIFFKQEEG